MAPPFKPTGPLAPLPNYKIPTKAQSKAQVKKVAAAAKSGKGLTPYSGAPPAYPSWGQGAAANGPSPTITPGDLIGLRPGGTPAAPSVAGLWGSAGATKKLLQGQKKTVTPSHTLATPPAPAPKPVITHPRTIHVQPGAAVAVAPAGGAPAAPVTVTPTSPLKSRVKVAKPVKTVASAAQAAAPAGPSLSDQITAALKAELDPQTAAMNSGYKELLDGLRAQQAKAQADALGQARNVQGFYGALTPLLNGVAPAVQGGYQDAANAIAGAAKGFSGALGDTASADAAQSQALLGASGAPQGQIDAAAQAAGTGGGAANALYGLGGYIPSAALSAQGAAFGAAARQLPATNAGVGAQNATEALGVGAANAKDIGTTISQAGQKHADDLATLMAGVPKLRNDLTAQFTDAAAKQNQLDFEHKLAALQYGDKTAATAFSQAATTARIKLASAADARASRSLDLTTMRTLSEITGQVMGPDGQPVLDAHGKPVLSLAGRKAALAQYKASRPASKGGFTKSQLASISAKSAKQADTQFWGTFAKDGVTVVTPAIADYQQALKEQLAAGVPLQIAQRSLNAHYPVGQEGRPYVPIQARVKLAAAGLPMADPLARPDAAQQQWMRAHGISWSA